MASAIAVVGLGYGNEGKGAIVDYLTWKTGSRLTVRFNGGPQASHCVHGPNGQIHSFSQFGSGTFRGAKTYLSEFCLVEPYAIIKEAEALSLDWAEQITFAPWSVIITPFHWMANRLREKARGSAKHGSCGRGVGEARRQQLNGLSFRVFHAQGSSWHVAHLLRAIEEELSISLYQAGIHDLGQEWDNVLRNIDAEAEFYCKFFTQAQIADIHTAFSSQQSPIIFEGAQGVLLDEIHGEEPYRTWTNCTFGNVELLCRITETKLYKLGVIRTYHTRHGEGPLPGEIAINNRHEKNGTNEWQGSFRTASFNKELWERALAIAKPDGVAINCLDVMSHPEPLACYPDILIGSYGPAAEQKIMLHFTDATNKFRETLGEVRYSHA